MADHPIFDYPRVVCRLTVSGMKTRFLLFLGAVAGALAQAQDVSVSGTRIFTDTRLGITITEGRLSLPKEGVWEVVGVHPEGALGELVLEPPTEILALAEGDRLGRINENRSIEEGRQHLSSLFWACRQYAENHAWVGPAGVDDLPDPQTRWLREQDALKDLVLLPNVPLREQFGEDPPSPDSRPLAFEVHPAIDDGKHWVLYNDGRTEREAINPERVAAHGLVIVPQGLSREQKLARLGETAVYRIFGRRGKPAVNAVRLTLHERLSERELAVAWWLADAAPGGEAMVRDWAALRVQHWAALSDPGGGSILGQWLARATDIYNVEPPRSLVGGRRRPGNRTSIFSVLGGRAAIRETLQMQDLGAGNDQATGVAEAPIETLKGVGVKAHEYEQILAGAEGGRLPLADLTPHDRFLAYFPRPAALGQFLDSGTDFLFNLSGGITGSSLRYGLLDRYLERLGMNEAFMRTLLDSEALAEVAVFLPDLFLIDGTDITVIARVRNPALLGGMLRLVGMGNLGDITARRVAGGGTAFWLQREDLIVISSHRAELERVVKLAEAGGAGSLGQSAEFRYMLTQLPVRETTRAFVYFSDPFIRRLTGPACKIGQYRRIQVRTQLEALSAGALLYVVDHAGDRPTVEQLLDLGYAPRIRSVDLAGIELDERSVARSARYGHAAGMTSLLETPVVTATAAEAAAYEDYRRNYEQFWRQFFDPIAVRLDQTAGDRMELETFILPLIDSTVYRGIREAVLSADAPVALDVPSLEPQPVAVFSINLREEAWDRWLRNLDQIFVRILGRRSAVLDQFGPAIHLAVADADPIIGTGSGDLLGVFGSDTRLNNEMIFLPVALSMLTRPCTLFVELKDPAAALAEMTRLPTGPVRRDQGFLGLASSLYRVAGEDEWIYTLSVEGFVTLRFGLRVQGRYLVVSNLPLTHRPTLRGVEPAPNNGMQLSLHPGAAQVLLPSLFAAAMERQRGAVMEGIGMLQPFMVSGAVSVEEAATLHASMFGFAPVHPAGGAYEWAGGVVRSPVFGQPGMERQPAFSDDAGGFGVLQRVRELAVSLQFEQEGLRVRSGWTFVPRGQ